MVVVRQPSHFLPPAPSPSSSPSSTPTDGCVSSYTSIFRLFLPPLQRFVGPFFSPPGRVFFGCNSIILSTQDALHVLPLLPPADTMEDRAVPEWEEPTPTPTARNPGAATPAATAPIVGSGSGDTLPGGVPAPDMQTVPEAAGVNVPALFFSPLPSYVFSAQQPTRGLVVSSETLGLTPKRAWEAPHRTSVKRRRVAGS